MVFASFFIVTNRVKPEVRVEHGIGDTYSAAAQRETYIYTTTVPRAKYGPPSVVNACIDECAPCVVLFALFV